MIALTSLQCSLLSTKPSPWNQNSHLTPPNHHLLQNSPLNLSTTPLTLASCSSTYSCRALPARIEAHARTNSSIGSTRSKHGTAAARTAAVMAACGCVSRVEGWAGVGCKARGGELAGGAEVGG